MTPQNLQPQRSPEDDAEYRSSYLAAEYTNALYALENGWTGKGVVIGVIDNGAVEIGELQGRISDLSKDFGDEFYSIGNDTTSKYRRARNVVGDDRSGHGTAVSAIIAGNNDGNGIQGLVPDAQIAILRVDDETPEENNTIRLHVDQAVTYGATKGIKILNMSLGYADPSYSDPKIELAVTLLKNAGGLLVNSTGNSAGNNPTTINDVSDRNRSAWLFVGAIDANGSDIELTSYSNRCGSAADRCVVAPGTYYSKDATGKTIAFSGTSAAAPQVSALAATILQKWPQLSGLDAGNIILNTARDIGSPGVDSKFGHGLMDFKAALSPVEPMLSNGVKSQSVADSRMIVGPAFGGIARNSDAAQRGALPTSFADAFGQVAVLDAYGRNFMGDVSGLIARTGDHDIDWLARRIRAQANSGVAGFVTPLLTTRVSYTASATGLNDRDGQDILQNHLTQADMSLRTSGGMLVTAGYNSGDTSIDDVMGLAATSDVMQAYSPLARTHLGIARPLGSGVLQVSAYTGQQANRRVDSTLVNWSTAFGFIKLGMLDEVGTVFGTPVGAGAMRFGDGASTGFTELGTSLVAGSWRFDGYASVGITRLKLANDMLLTHADPIPTGRFGLIGNRLAWGGTVSLGLTQPLTAFAGTATFTAADGYDLANRSLTFSTRHVDLAGDIRPQFSIGYKRTGERSDLRIGAASDLHGRDARIVGNWTVKMF